MTKADATAKRDEFMRTVNGSGEPEVGGVRPVLLREFIDQKYLPFQRGKWKKSTQGTSENRIMHHVVKGLGDTALKGLLPYLASSVPRKQSRRGIVIFRGGPSALGSQRDS